MSEICRSCGKPFTDFQALATHIMSSKKGHRNGRIWAARFLTRVRELDRKGDRIETRTALTEEQKETRISLVRELSGEVHTVLCVCPNKRCGRGHTERIEVEYLESPNAWLSTSGHPMILCGSCR